ncbi:hypothetical protein VC83_09379 [Pseudogymnoascus destructans]|uniref:Uncharacterized protein n=1 Tax=Pseudogymnoascus destructans TaxID=655981 RepID=A0A176ZZS3_9PEZI|nr:uncharacterized protein VC83_09379 [Pseudogymnoascus destructans]OAF54333.1 hypothetical protein VC83_09379 [Pseudogymnoascus destructans]
MASLAELAAPVDSSEFLDLDAWSRALDDWAVNERGTKTGQPPFVPGVLKDAGLARITEDFCHLGQSLQLCWTWSAHAESTQSLLLRVRDKKASLHAAAPVASLGIIPGLAAGLIIGPFSYENRGVYGGVYSPFSYENGGSF